MSRRVLVLFLTLLASLSPGQIRAQGILITELMADNADSVADEDNDHPDWVELFNSGEAEVNLDGYYLTDNSANLTKWRFPAYTLGAKRFLVVFCSGKDYTDPAQPLHTSFKLSNDGAEILLVAPDATTVVFRYGGYPEQQADISYGVATSSTFTNPIQLGAVARAFVPTSDALGQTWTDPDFDDAAWKQGTTAVGYGVRSPELEQLGLNVEAEMKNINASIYIRIPFDIADPTKVDVLKLRLRYDDGFVAYINGKLVASSNAPEPLAFNSDALRAHLPSAEEEFDISGGASSLRAGKNVLAIQGLNDSVNNTDAFFAAEVEAIDVGEILPDVKWFFPEPTPGEPNGKGFVEAAPRPLFSLPSGTYVDARNVEISTELAGGVIHYTVDGTQPTESSPVYAAPIAVTGPTRITARVYKEGLAPGIPERNTYIILDPGVAGFTTNVPLVLVTTFGKAIGTNCGGGPYTPGHVLIITPNEQGTAVITDAAEVSSGAAFRRRGSSTCGVEKMAFNVEFRDSYDGDKEVKVFDYPKESDYIMFGGNNFDRINMRNPIAYFMSRAAGQYAVRTKYVECFYHPGKGPVTQGSYFGIYAFMEKNKPHEDKINVARIGSRDKKEPAVTGGYIMRRDRVGPDEIQISGGGYSSLVFVYPQSPVREQQTYMSQFMGRVISSLNPNIGSQADNALIDFNGWLDHHIICWYTKNVDAFRLSGYFHKDRGGPLVMGPVWDFDRTMGCSDDDRARTPEGYNNDSSGDGGTRYFEAGGLGSWYSFLFNNKPPTTDTPWNRAYKARWRELRKGPLSTENILGQIDAWALELKDASDRNTARWRGLAPRFGSYQGEVNHLKNWLSTRAEWIDSQFIESPKMAPAGGTVARGTQVTMTISIEATIYYTTDGADPRGAGNVPAATATAYAGPLTINQNTIVSARARFPDGSWSGLVSNKYVTDVPTLQITEIMFNPSAPTVEEDPEGKFTVAKMEFVEVTNVGDQPVNLKGITFTKGVTFTFDGVSPSQLAPGQSVVVVRDRLAFAARYKDPGILVVGDFTGTIADQGESFALKGAFDEEIFDFRFVGSWYAEANGGGYSLVNKDPRGPAETLGEQTRWGPSASLNGSPGVAEGLSGGNRVVPGDTNRDGKLQITDGIRTLLMLFGGLQDGPCGQGLELAANQKVLDWDGNAKVDLADALASLRYLFQEGPTHIAGRACTAFEGCQEACTQ